MHLPMVKHLFSQSVTPPKIVPIVVGSLTQFCEIDYAKILAPYMADERTLFIISSDFCHWGDDFDFTPYENLKEEHDQEWTPIWEFVQALDMAGIELIESADHEGFYRYCEETENTICGRHPIGILLAMLQCKSDAQVH